MTRNAAAKLSLDSIHLSGHSLFRNYFCSLSDFFYSQRYHRYSTCLSVGALIRLKPSMTVYLKRTRNMDHGPTTCQVVNTRCSREMNQHVRSHCLPLPLPHPRFLFIFDVYSSSPHSNASSARAGRPATIEGEGEI